MSLAPSTDLTATTPRVDRARTHRRLSVCPCCGTPVDPLEILVDRTSGVVAFGGVEVRLAPVHLTILQLLIDHHPATVRTGDLYDHLYQLSHSEPDPKVIDVHLCNMRKALRPVGLGIIGEWGYGARLAAIGDPDWRNQSAERRATRIAGTQHDDEVRERLAGGQTLSVIARHLGLSYRATARIIDRIRGEARD
jgi:hypothetical protein